MPTPRPLLLSLAALAGCFAIDPLPDCSDRSRSGSLYVPHHVCMVAAGPALELPGEPQELVIGDFDGEGIANDVAILLEPDKVRVYAGLDLSAPVVTREIPVLDGASEVEGLISVRLFSDSAAGDDLLAWVIGAYASQPDGEGALVALVNGGDVFAAEVKQQVALDGLVDDDDDIDTPDVPSPCPMPADAVVLHSPERRRADGVILTCESSGDAELDAILVTNIPGLTLPQQAQLGIKAAITGIHAAGIGPIDAVGSPDLLFAYTPPGDDHDHVAVVLVSDVPDTAMIDLEPERGLIDHIVATDLDQDGSTDIIALHTEDRGFSVIQQRAPLEFSEPVFYTPGFEANQLVVADFTGDGGLDIAVAHPYDNAGLHAITLFVRAPDLPAGSTSYEPMAAGYFSGNIVGLAVLDLDGDPLADLAVAVRDGSRGYISILANRSPGDSTAE